MRALVCREYGPPESLLIEDWDTPALGDDEVLVDVKAAGINFPDILSIAGTYQVKTPLPFVPGNEAAGTVRSVGKSVTHYAVGDKVIAMLRGGAFAEQCVAEEIVTAPLPDGLDFEQGAGFSVTYGTSYHALKHRAELNKGETVLVLGAAGGVGIAAVEIAKALGARVIAAASSDEKLEFASQAGADELINYTTQALNETTKAMTDGAGVDVVYDPVGGELALQALRATAWHGRYLVIGFASGDIPNFPANISLLKEASIVGVWWGTWAAKNRALQRQSMKELSVLVTDGVLNPRVTESYALDDFVSAFSAIKERRARGKVILKMH